MIGTLIYAKEGYGVYEVDGEKHQVLSSFLSTCMAKRSGIIKKNERRKKEKRNKKAKLEADKRLFIQLFTQNLSLFAKLFLDNKSVFFDIVSFNYYVLLQSPSCTTFSATFGAEDDASLLEEWRIVGFFSKEKVSWDNNNLACILVFPPWQGQGLGKILMGISYELSEREGRIGGPEKPLSELGRKGYTHFWRCRVANQILSMKAETRLSVGELAEYCWILPEDVIVALKEIPGALLATKKADGSAVVSKSKIRDWVRLNRVDLTPPVCHEDFNLNLFAAKGGAICK